MYNPRTPSIVVTLATLTIFALLLVVGAQAKANPYPCGAACVHATADTVKIDTGDRAEDEQPPFTVRLAAKGWDYNPGCNKQGQRFDWFAPGQPCNERDPVTGLHI